MNFNYESQIRANQIKLDIFCIHRNACGGIALFSESEGGWFKSPSPQISKSIFLFITPCSDIVFCKTFYFEEMARINPSNQNIQNAKFLLYDCFHRMLKILGENPE